MSTLYIPSRPLPYWKSVRSGLQQEASFEAALSAATSLRRGQIHLYAEQRFNPPLGPVFAA